MALRWWVLALAGCSLAAASCGQQELLIELRHPAALDPAALTGNVTITVREADGGATVGVTSVAAKQLGSRRSLFSGLSLVAGRRYELRVVAEAAAPCAGARAQGASPPFTYQDSVDRLAVYFDCGDTSSPTGSSQDVRIVSGAAFLPEPAPHGQVILAGGADLSKPDPGLVDLLLAPALASIERYDPAGGTFTRLAVTLTVPRAALQATPVGNDRVIFTGGIGRNALKLPVGSKLVEQLTGETLAPLPVLSTARGVHQALLLGDRLLLVGGVSEKLDQYLDTVEVINVSKPDERQTLLMSAGRLYPAVAPLDQRRVLIVGGNPDPAVAVPSNLFCTGGCSACSGTCLAALPGLAPGASRASVAGVQVACGERSAVYVIGGLRRTAAETVYLDEILCASSDQPGALTPAGKLVTARSLASAVLVRGPSGPRIFVAGGYNGKPIATGELFPASCSCPAAPLRTTEVKLNAARSGHAAVPLADGSVLLVGGTVGSRSAERFNPAF